MIHHPNIQVNDTVASHDNPNQIGLVLEKSEDDGDGIITLLVKWNEGYDQVVLDEDVYKIG